MTRSLTRTFLAATLFALLAGAAWACPACKEAVASQGDPLARGWSRSIYLLMGAPYVLFAGAASYIARAARRKQSHRTP